MRYYLFYTGRMEYARLIIISSLVGDFFQSWLFHVILLKRDSTYGKSKILLLIQNSIISDSSDFIPL